MIAPDSKMLTGAPPPFGAWSTNTGHAVVGIDLQKVRFELIAASDIAGDYFVVETELLQQNGDLLAVWRGPKMDIEHRYSFFG